jgi:LmbE family N-acetylglucosaminyl deacetylase
MPTIVPRTPEADWLQALQGLASWDAPLVPTLVLAPHPDDETLGSGGLIARLRQAGVPVAIVAVTDGEGAYDETPDLGSTRVLEQNEAIRRLGVPIDKLDRFHLPDKDVSLYEDELVNRLLNVAMAYMHLIAPWPFDFHPDHEAVGRAAARVAEHKGLPITYYLFWTWHRGEPETLRGLNTHRLNLTDTEVQTKLHALQAYVSQFEHADGQPILSPRLLDPAHRPFEVYIR